MRHSPSPSPLRIRIIQQPISISIGGKTDRYLWKHRSKRIFANGPLFLQTTPNLTLHGYFGFLQSWTSIFPSCSGNLMLMGILVTKAAICLDPRVFQDSIGLLFAMTLQFWDQNHYGDQFSLLESTSSVSALDIQLLLPIQMCENSLVNPRRPRLFAKIARLTLSIPRWWGIRFAEALAIVDKVEFGYFGSAACAAVFVVIVGTRWALSNSMLHHSLSDTKLPRTSPQWARFQCNSFDPKIS